MTFHNFLLLLQRRWAWCNNPNKEEMPAPLDKNWKNKPQKCPLPSEPLQSMGKPPPPPVPGPKKTSSTKRAPRVVQPFSRPIGPPLKQLFGRELLRAVGNHRVQPAGGVQQLKCQGLGPAVAQKPVQKKKGARFCFRPPCPSCRGEAVRLGNITSRPLGSRYLLIHFG